MHAAKMHASCLQDVINIARWGSGMTTTEPENSAATYPAVGPDLHQSQIPLMQGADEEPCRSRRPAYSGRPLARG